MSEPHGENRQLAEIFCSLGVTDPDAWARTQTEEGIPQLAICLFLKLAVEPIRQLNDSRALRGFLRRTGDNEAIKALNRLKTSGQPTDDVLRIVRSALLGYLTDLCFLIDNTASIRFSGWPFESTLDKVKWGLFQVDEHGKAIASMFGLNEVVHEFTSEVSGSTSSAQQGDEADRNIPGE